MASVGAAKQTHSVFRGAEDGFALKDSFELMIFALTKSDPACREEFTILEIDPNSRPFAEGEVVRGSFDNAIMTTGWFD